MINTFTVEAIKSFKKSKKKFAAITAYDFTSASIIDNVLATLSESISTSKTLHPSRASAIEIA